MTRMLPVSVTIDPEDPQPKDIADYFAAVARRLDERPEPMRIVVTAPKGVALDMDASGRLVACVSGRRPAALDIRRRWIADHPVPLSLAGRTTLIVRPVDANRFRVRLRRIDAVLRWMGGLISRR